MCRCVFEEILGYSGCCTNARSERSTSRSLNFFSRAEDRAAPRRKRASSYQHNKQIIDLCHAKSPDYLTRSILGMTYVYNLLPQVVIEAASVTIFQRLLSDMAKQCCKEGCEFETLYCHLGVREPSQTYKENEMNYNHCKGANPPFCVSSYVPFL